MKPDFTVIHVDDGRSWRGGQHQVALLAEGLAARGISQILVAPPGSPLAERAAKSGIRVEPVDMKGELDFASPRRIAGLAPRDSAVIIHAHTSHAHTLARRALRHLSSGSAPGRLVVTRRVDFAVSRGFFSRRKYRAPDQYFIAISDAVGRALQAGGVDPARIELVPSGVPPIPPEKVMPREEGRRLFGIEPGEFAIVSVGALTDHKGHKFLIEAAAQIAKRHRRARFYILGKGELRGALQAQIAAAKLEGVVRMPGFVEGARLKLAAFDLFVSSSHMEGLGTAILDSMLAGLPVVASAAGGVPDAVVHNVTGLLAAPGDSLGLAREIAAAIEMPEEPRARIAAAAREHASVNFSVERMVEGNSAVYAKLLAAAAEG